MISFVEGILAEVGEGRIVVQTGGLGIEINVPLTVIGTLPQIGEEIKVYTYFKVSEDAMSLYGFNSRRDQKMFESLIGVSGIGPKGALAILSALSPDDLRMAIMMGDAKSISAAQGIGAKTAQRVILELKDKIDVADVIGAPVNIAAGGNAVGGSRSEAIEALMAMGFGSGEAARAVRDVEGEDVETIIKAALKNLYR